MLRLWKFISLFQSLFQEGQVDAEEIERKGLLAVKIAQMYAVRSDLLGVEKCRSLQTLFETTSPIPFKEVEEVLQSSAPEKFWEEVEDISQTPLAAASLGQVHLARHKDGSKVAVKVIKPQAQQDFQKDLRAVRFLATVAVTFYPKLKRLADPIGTLATVERLTMTELDLRNESKGAARLYEILKEGSRKLEHLEKLHFPSYYDDLSSEQVLVSEFLPYKSVSKGLEDGDFQYEHLLNLFRTQGYFLFLHGTFHGDLHPGNVFFRGEELWFLDNANVEEADPSFTQGLLHFLGKLGERDFSGAAEVMVSLSLSPPKDPETYARDFSALYDGFQSGRSSLTTQMMETVKLCVHAGMEFPEGAFPVIKSLMYLDGIALKCAPEANLLEDVLAYTSDLS